MESLEDTEGLREPAQIGSRAGKFEVAGELEREVAESGEGEERVYQVQELRFEGVLHLRNAIHDATYWGRHTTVRRRYGQACERRMLGRDCAKTPRGALRKLCRWCTVCRTYHGESTQGWESHSVEEHVEV